MTTPQPINTWLNRPKPGSEARLRLFCFPYAGGGASLYRSWAEPLASVAEIWSVQLPGRENRLGEPLYRSLPEGKRPPSIVVQLAMTHHQSAAKLEFLAADLEAFSEEIGKRLPAAQVQG